MGPKHSHVYVSFLLLLILPLVAQSRILKADGQSFQFLQSLEGSQKGQTLKGVNEVKQHLTAFGYYPNDGEALDLTDDFDDLLEYALKAYQKNYRLKVTGILDSDTIKEMMIPRCGVPDPVNHHSKQTKEVKDGKESGEFMASLYTFNGGKWPPSQTQLTYTFSSSAQAVDSQVLRSVCSSAFKRWADVTQFSFQEVSEGAQADIVIGFHRGDHGDGVPFDGPGNVLAHSFRPTDGRFHIDADESWSTNPSMNEMDLESVTVHEIGHLLGLGHTMDAAAIMYPKIPSGTIKRELTQDDIGGIQSLYSN